MGGQTMMEIDDALYSRQRCVLGENAMLRLQKSKVFVCGLAGVGIEIAKNLVLGGIGELFIQDDVLCDYADLGTQFFIRTVDIEARKSRAEASLPHLAALNPYVRVVLQRRNLASVRSPLTDTYNTDLLHPLVCSEQGDRVDCLVLSQCSLHAATLLDQFCRKHDIRFIYTDVYGVMGHLFCDFGSEFLISDPNGEPLEEFFVGHIERQSSTQLLIKVYADRRHHLETGDLVRFQELSGMVELNNQTFAVQVVSPSELVIFVDTDNLSSYTGGGIGRQVLRPETMSFTSLLEQLRQPTISTADLSCPDEGILLHRVFLTLMKFQHEKRRLPEPWDEDDWNLFSVKFEVLGNLLSEQLKTAQVDLGFVRRLILVSKGQLAPLCALFGGVAAQEAMKAITGSFTPFHQWLYMHCASVVPEISQPLCWHNTRYTPLTACIGPDCLQRLRNLSVFMVGCGAIGCELLKNLALLGVATTNSIEESRSTSDVTTASSQLSSSSTIVGQTPEEVFDLSISTQCPHLQTSSISDSPSSIATACLLNPGGSGDVASQEFVPVSSAISNSRLQPLPTEERTNPMPELGDYTRTSHVELISSISPAVEDLPSPTLVMEPSFTDTDTNFQTDQSEAETAGLLPQMCETKTMDESASHTELGESSSDVLIGQPKCNVEALDEANTKNRSALDMSDSIAARSPAESCEVTSITIAEPHVPGKPPNIHDRAVPLILVTDPDHIEKSNLNRQFLFHSEHIGQSKSQVAAVAIRAMNPGMQIKAMSEKFCPTTAKTIFTDEFFQFILRPIDSSALTGVVLAALDCVVSRRYVDTRCVSLRMPLFESGTLGAKGHVQVILPGRTESYNSQRDDDSSAGSGPTDAQGAQSIPYCTLKSFPSLPSHCIEWAREKFASSFTLKPQKLSQLLTSLDRATPGVRLLSLASYLLQRPDVTDGTPPPSDTTTQTNAMWLCSQLTRGLVHFLVSRPVDWVGCVQLARDKFERYFNHKARQLLHTFPPETKLADGSSFWKLPRRQPTAVVFDVTNPLHQQFVISYARLLADQLNIPVPNGSLYSEAAALGTHLEACFIGHRPPVFAPSSKLIVTDDTDTPAQPQSDRTSSSNSSTVGTIHLDEHLVQALQMTVAVLRDPRRLKTIYSCRSLTFEKDNDQLPHVDFITAASNLRATMYGLSLTPRHEVRRIAGRIVPAIATTTAAVAGLVCIELVKYVCSSSCSTTDARNAFLNLALPVILLSEPAPCVQTRLPNGETFTLWDRWVLPVPDSLDTYRVIDLINDIKRRHGLGASLITQGNRMIYVNYLPLHQSRLYKPLKSLLTIEPDDAYVDLMIAYDAGPDSPPDADYVQGPPVRLSLLRL